MKSALVLAASFSIACSMAFIFGYQFHKSSQPELKGIMAGYNYAKNGDDLNRLFELVAFDNKTFQTLNRIESDDDLAKAKESARKQLLDSIEDFEKFSLSVEGNHHLSRYKIMLNEVNKIRGSLTEAKSLSD